MISLMCGNGKLTTEKNLRLHYLERLREIAEDAPRGHGPLVRDAAEAAPAEKAMPEIAQADVAAPGGWREESTEAIDADQFRLLAERIAPKCIEALTEAMRGMHRPAAGEQGKAEDAIRRMIAVSDEIQRINREISSLHESTESLTSAESDLATKAATLEGRLAECAANDRKVMAELGELANSQTRDRESQTRANLATEERLSWLEHGLTERLGALEKRVAESSQTISVASEHLEAIKHSLERHTEVTARVSGDLCRVEETQQALQRQLESHAEVLRKLYASERERGSQLQTALQKMKELTVGFFMPAPLPEEL